MNERITGHTQLIGKKMTIVGAGGVDTVDVPYSPLETSLRKMAKEVGCKTMNGLGMMLFQGSAAFELWTGEPMPIGYMKEILHISYDDQRREI